MNYISTDNLSPGVHTTAVHAANEVIKFYRADLIKLVEFVEDFDEACDYIEDFIIDLSEEERIEANWVGQAPNHFAIQLEDLGTRQCAVANIAEFLNFEEPDYNSNTPSHDADAQAERRQMGFTW